MDRWHNHYLDHCAHFITSTVQDWQPCLLDHAEELYQQWRDGAAKHRCLILAYVVMPEHIHMVVWAEEGARVSAFTQRWLSMTARMVGTGGRFWKERPRVLAIWSRKVLGIKVDYIHKNALRRGLAVDPAGWVHSSFRQLEEGQRDVPFLCDDFDAIGALRG